MISLTQTSIEEAFKNKERMNLTVSELAQEIVNGTHDISYFVDKLGFALTSPTVELRVNGTKLLAFVLSELPKDLLNATQLEFLGNFFADRLKDHHNVMPPVIDGIAALVKMSNFPGKSVPILLNSFFQHTTCQSQVRSDRTKLYEIFKWLSLQYTDELKAMSGDFIYGFINSIEGERDPRNLEFIFSFMPDFIANYSLLHLSEEMFEVFSCYFPIDFTPSKQDPDRISREELAGKLAYCLVASPDFVEWAVALALEKLQSDLTVAKLDSLELLHLSAVKFPPKLIEPHFENIWNSLKTEIFPGSDNPELVAGGLRALRSLLQNVRVVDKDHNYQTIIMGCILQYLSDVNQRLFNPAVAIALVCVSGDPKFASEKILNCFLLKLNETTEITQRHDEQCIKFYTIIAQMFKLVSMIDFVENIRHELCSDLLKHVMSSLRCTADGNMEEQSLDLKRAALNLLNESTCVMDDSDRILVYKALTNFIIHDTIDLEFKLVLQKLAASYPDEVLENVVDVCTCNFSTYPNFVKGKIYKNLLSLVNKYPFTPCVLDLLLLNIFSTGAHNDTNERLLALTALELMLANELPIFVRLLQMQRSLVDKLVNLAQTEKLELELLEHISTALSLIVEKLAKSEQYTIVGEYLPKLDLQLEADLFVANGLLGFLHEDLSIDDHFERLLDDLTALSLGSDRPELRLLAHHLLCSLVNKATSNERNNGVIAKIIANLKAEIKKENAKAVELLSWLAKGLIVQGHQQADDVIETLAELLNHPSLSAAACLAFEIMSTEFPTLHLPVARCLFKQKFFHTIVSKLGKNLESYCEHHLNAFIYVLKSTPHTVLKMNIDKVGPLLFKCLECTQLHTLSIALEICERFIKQQDEYFRSHLSHIIPSCITLSAFKESMKVRIAALNLLYDITKYPTHVLLPHKLDVVLALVPALDDQKRLVRNAAANARNAWYLKGAAFSKK